jgi:hypothetical protein
MKKLTVPFIVMDGHIIKAYWLGKWRTLRYYGGNKDIPSKKIEREAIETFRMNAGLILQDVEIIPDWQVDWQADGSIPTWEHAYTKGE